MTNRQVDRNYGIDLLRIVAMVGVVANHLIMQGGVLHSATNEIQSAVIWLVEIMAYLAVDCYVLISGYVNFPAKQKELSFTRIIDLWLQVVFWGIFLDIVLGYFIKGDISISSILKSLLPVTFQQYWFFSAYFGLFFLMPALNQICISCTNKRLKQIILVCVLVFSVYATFVSPIGDQFLLSGGFSIAWFCMLYIIGAAIRKWDLSYINSRRIFVFLSLSIAVTWFCVVFLGKITYVLVGKRIGESILVAYNSPTILIASICLTIIFSRIEIKRCARAIKFWASATFGVYIIHMHPIVKNDILTNTFRFIGNSSPFLIPILIICISIFITVGCLLLDKGREYFFKLLRLPVFEKKIDDFVNNVFDLVLGD